MQQKIWDVKHGTSHMAMYSECPKGPKHSAHA